MLRILSYSNWFVLGLAATLIIGGSVAVLWSLFWNRSRGRRRCPRCWYDMTGSVGLTLRCPECGKTARSERQLRKTRRRPLFAALAVVVVIIGLALPYVQYVRSVGWSEAAPTLYYIAKLPDIDAGSEQEELARRIRSGTMRQWEYRYLVNRCITILNTHDVETEELVRTIDLLTHLEIAGRVGRKGRPWASWARASEIDPEGVVDSARRLLERGNADVSIAAITMLDFVETDISEAIPALLGQLVADDASIRAAAAAVLYDLDTYVTTLRPSLSNRSQPRESTFPRSALDTLGDDLARNGEVGESRLAGDQRSRAEYPGLELVRFLELFRSCSMNKKEAVPILVDGLDSRSANVRAVAAWALAMMEHQDAQISARIAGLMADADTRVRRVVIQMSPCLVLTEELTLELAEVLRGSNSLKLEGIRAVGRMGSNGSIFAERIGAELASGEGELFDAAAQAWIGIGGDPSIASGALLDLLQAGYGEWGTTQSRVALEMLGALGIVPEGRCREIERMLDEEEPVIRCAAAFAVGKSGCDVSRATEVLVTENQEGSYSVWRYSHQCLSGLAQGGHISVTEMCRLLDSEDGAERRLAARILGAAGSTAKAALPRLKELREDEDGFVADEADYAIDRIMYALNSGGE
jgi:HEAT repeat protein